MKKFLQITLLIFGQLAMISVPAQLHSTAPPPNFEPLQLFLHHENIQPSDWPRQTLVAQSELPKPYDFLLMQPVMTVGVADYYRRTPENREPLYVVEDAKSQQYSRAVLMVIDKDIGRDKALLADARQESLVVELGLITMNFAALPQSVISAVKTTQIPFGALLKKNHIKTHSAGVHFFALECNATVAKYLPKCEGKRLYGRTNTLVGTDGQWVANVVEILTGVES